MLFEMWISRLSYLCAALEWSPEKFSYLSHENFELSYISYERVPHCHILYERSITCVSYGG